MEKGFTPSWVQATLRQSNIGLTGGSQPIKLLAKAKSWCSGRDKCVRPVA
jgi:hypothetical protein